MPVAPQLLGFHNPPLKAEGLSQKKGWEDSKSHSQCMTSWNGVFWTQEGSCFPVLTVAVTLTIRTAKPKPDKILPSLFSKSHKQMRRKSWMDPPQHMAYHVYEDGVLQRQEGIFTTTDSF